MRYHSVGILPKKGTYRRYHVWDIDEEVFLEAASSIDNKLQIFSRIILKNEQEPNDKLMKTFLVFQKKISDIIYNFLLIERHGEGKKYAKKLKEYLVRNAKEYRDGLNALEARLKEINPPPKVLNDPKGSGWFHIQLDNSAEKTIWKGFKIHYKEYYTIALDPSRKRAMKSDQHLLGLPSGTDFYDFADAIIFKLADRFNQLSIAEKGNSISFKFPAELRTFVNHPDTIVIHYTNSALRRKIRKIVREVDYSETIFVLERGRKPKSGFDLYHDKLVGDGEGSHGTIIARLMALELITNPPRSWRKDNTPENKSNNINIISNWLKKELEKDYTDEKNIINRILGEKALLETIIKKRKSPFFNV